MLKSPGTASFVAALVVALLLDLRVVVRGDRAPVTAQTMTAARKMLDEIRQPGDVVVHSPLLTMRELAPLGDLRASPALPSAQLLASRRILLLDVAAQPMHGFGEPAEVREIGALVLRLHPPSGGAAPGLFDLLEHHERARMWIERPAGNITSHCTARRSEGGRACPGEPDWLYLAPRQLVVSGLDAHCIWAHPTTGGVVVIELPPQSAPPSGRKLQLELSGALNDDAVRQTSDGAKVITSVRQGALNITTLTVSNRTGWQTIKTDMKAGAPIELRVTTARDGRRHHCLNARIQEVPAP